MCRDVFYRVQEVFIYIYFSTIFCDEWKWADKGRGLCVCNTVTEQNTPMQNVFFYISSAPVIQLKKLYTFGRITLER